MDSIMDLMNDDTVRVEASIWLTPEQKDDLEQYLSERGIRYLIVYRTVKADG